MGIQYYWGVTPVLGGCFRGYLGRYLDTEGAGVRGGKRVNVIFLFKVEGLHMNSVF